MAALDTQIIFSPKQVRNDIEYLLSFEQPRFGENQSLGAGADAASQVIMNTSLSSKRKGYDTIRYIYVRSKAV